MEVTGAAASIAGLICFAAQAAQVAAQLHDFLTTVSEAPREIEDLSRDLLHLHGLLSNVANIGMKLEKTTFVDDSTLLNIEGCMTDLKKLDMIVQRVQSGANDCGIAGKGRRGWNRVKWAFWESEVKKSMGRLTSHKQTISLALSSLGRSLDIQAMMSVKSLQDSVNRIIESQDRTLGGLEQFGETSEFIRRSLGTISHHIQNSNTTTLHENLVAMIRSEITSGVQEALISTFSGISNGGNSLLVDRIPQKSELDNIVAQDIPSLKEDADALLNFNGSNEICDPPSSDQTLQPSASSLDLRYRKYHRYETVFGVLLVFISNETTHWNMFPTTFRGRKDMFEAGFTFIPASWLFKTAFAASFLKYANRNGESSISTNLSYYALVPYDAKIMEFSRSGNVDGIRQLFSQRLATPRDRDDHGRTPLHWAASAGNYETCKLLLENGADPSATNSVNRTPLHWTTLLSCNADIISLLISHGCDPSIPNISGQSALFAHNTQGRMDDLIRSIVHQDHFVVDLDHVDYLGRTPLMWELYEMNDNTDSSVALINGGASVTRTDNQGFTALHHTLLCSKTKYKKETVRLLLKSGADPLARSNDGFTPTEIAKHVGVMEDWKETLSECGFDLGKIGRDNLDGAISTATDNLISSLQIGGPRLSGVKRRHAAISKDDAIPLPVKPPERDYTFSIDQIPRRIQYDLFAPLFLPNSQTPQPPQRPKTGQHETSTGMNSHLPNIPPSRKPNSKTPYAVPAPMSQSQPQGAIPYNQLFMQSDKAYNTPAKRQRVSSDGVSSRLGGNNQGASSVENESISELDFLDSLVSQQNDWRGGNMIMYEEEDRESWISPPPGLPCEFKSSYWAG